MAESLPPIGFWSYTSSDDSASRGRLSQLRPLLTDQLRLLIGRRQTVRIWQDVTAIPHGADWHKAIHHALGESSFLIPIITPAFLESKMCCQEFMRFREREQELGRDDLIFPLLYVNITHFTADDVHDPAVLDLLNRRQWIDLSSMRLRPADSEEVLTKLAALAESIHAALRRSVTSEPPVRPQMTQAPASQPPELPRPAIFIPPARPDVFPGKVMREAPGPEMVLVPEGRFLMGAPEAESKREGRDDSDARPRHLVTIARPFWLGKYPVTQGEYAAFAAETGRGADPWTSTRFPQDERHPAVNVFHDDALAYVAWLSQQTGQTYRLPSEAEWEYAARAGTTTARYWGEAAGKPGEHAQFSKNIGDAGGTCAVGSFSPNAFGLHDMLGNVWEWTADPWHTDYTGAPSDGSAWTAGGAAGRVIRGGSWALDAGYVRAALRLQYYPADRDESLGFRCARVQVPASGAG